jgi:hypothetical protein
MEKKVLKIDQKDYPFKKYIDEHKHLDCDEHRHEIKPIIHIINEHCKGEEHKYCDKEQLDAAGKYRRPKKLIEAEQRGFKSVSDMVETDKKDEEDKKNNVITQLLEKQNALEQTLQEILSHLKK